MGRNIIDITGHVIGNFEIIEHVHTRYWAVRCTPCGKIVNMQKCQAINYSRKARIMGKRKKNHR